jgi:hypothetical protein
MDKSKTLPTHLESCRYLTFVPRGFGFVHHSIAILDHQVPNPNLTIRNFFDRSTRVAALASQWPLSLSLGSGERTQSCDSARRGCPRLPVATLSLSREWRAHPVLRLGAAAARTPPFQLRCGVAALPQGPHLVQAGQQVTGTSATARRRVVEREQRHPRHKRPPVLRYQQLRLAHPPTRSTLHQCPNCAATGNGITWSLAYGGGLKARACPPPM